MTENTMPDNTTAPSDAQNMSYEQARDELVTVVRTLEGGNLPLEESLRLWQRGEELADRCQAWLDGARETLNEAQAKRENNTESAE
ncbi:exodeoxyribonuclease VII small subunit [Brevibacterium sp. HMSC24B04]|uniref:exodeoxyribonuclease VII small subunit n=1 Tax=Brevibacterium sp. HMSC24B04 TaxID=1581060 RepID=UPI0008A57386|nr:exodeoxyribonuclease VII small subunit [Brevibacterium sp. HMSC24B04]OFT94811.1 exodeoxyribonuclease VII small subunit [Brevibacterium sp. HMSC24B04]